ncbi:MAG: AraC family transcriptional regulator, partial [Fimbriimonadaceae bacterium]
EGARTLSEIAEESERVLESATQETFSRRSGPTEALIDRALAIVERNYAKELTDSSVAAQLGLSNSHFRHLFKQTTGQPFHQYLIAVRLEHARQMLLDQDISVSQVASAVGFQGLSHFSRAFTQRFQVSPTRLRRQVG